MSDTTGIGRLRRQGRLSRVAVPPPGDRHATDAAAAGGRPAQPMPEPAERGRWPREWGRRRLFRRQPGLPWRLPLLAGLMAVVVAAALVKHLDRQFALEQRQRTAVVLEQVAERNARALAAQLRDVFGGALVDAIEGIGHRELRAYNLARIDRFLDEGTIRFPYVSRFFFWHEQMPGRFGDQVVFYRPRDEAGSRDIPIPGADSPSSGFFADGALGRDLWRMSRDLVAVGRSFAIEEIVRDGSRYQVIAHLLWADARRDGIFSVIGYLVDLERIRHGPFEQIVEHEVTRMPPTSLDYVQLAVYVGDEHGRPLYGVVPPDVDVSVSEGLDVLFFPREDLEPYVANMPVVPRWELTVSAVALDPMTARSAPWLWAAVVGLLLVAVACAVSVHRQAIRLSRLQSDFVANASHQLRTPLAMLSAAAETLGLERVRSPEKVRQYADIVRAQTERLSVLVDQILLFHRAQRAYPSAVCQPVDLGDLVARAADDLQVLARRAGVTIRVQRDAHGPVVDGDPVALEHVVLNLLENAMKHGEPRHEVTVAADVRQGCGAIVVRDTGAGISRADLPHIFEQFYRGHGEHPPRRGFGLGLAIVRSTVAKHGGRITVESEPGRGSVFTVLLPLSV